MKKLFAVGAALLLGACTSIPVKTLYKLATADLMTVDPSVLRVAAQMPDWVAPRPEGVKLELGLKRDGETPINERFNLEAVPLALEGKTLTDAAKSDYTLYAYRLASVDIPRLQHFRDTLKAKKADGGKKPESTMGVSVDACRKTELPAGKILATTYLQLDRESGYLPLLVDYDLKQEVDGKDLAALIPPCQ
ncbi:hypothetical protein [Thiothrix lacustris]|jgi:hypothetical protein|uniref:hypothetical protein n=1 Tax=Thiothrix lacustris TaxID=525917 RepID=UPI0027E4FE85|nr:hypothetical protein [Thiothrix lacustris]WMP16560.1 hypothetical protein RCS87_14340 [Thiothrix lacustris]